MESNRNTLLCTGMPVHDKVHNPSCTFLLHFLWSCQCKQSMLPCCCRLMPGVDVEIMLRRNPGVVYSVQRGSSSLGPGAEFMGRS